MPTSFPRLHNALIRDTGVSESGVRQSPD